MATKGQTIKLRVIRKNVALGLYRMEVVKFTDDTYRSLSDDTIIMSSSNKKEWCALKGSCSTRKAFLEKAMVELVYKFDEKSYRECLSIAKVRSIFCPQTYMYIYNITEKTFTSKRKKEM